MTCTHTSTDTHAGLFEKWLPGDLSGNKVALWRTLGPTTFEIHFMQQPTCSKPGPCHLCLLTTVTHSTSYSFCPSLSPFLCLPQFVSASHSWPCVHQMRMLDLQVGSKTIRNALWLSGSWCLCDSLAISLLQLFFSRRCSCSPSLSLQSSNAHALD